MVRDFQIKTPLRKKWGENLAKGCFIELAKEHPFSNFDPLIMEYSPPKDCGPINEWSFISLNITATVNGTQYDRLGIFFMNNVEIWRTSSSEPTKAGIIWTTMKEVTRYRSLFSKEGRAVFHLGNEVFGPYTGIFRTTINLVFHPKEQSHPTNSLPDQIIPILPKQTGNDSNLFSVGQNSLQNPSFSLLKIPSNTKEAWIEIFASGNGNEEFWYTNVPDELAKNFSSIGKGPFREIQVLLDGRLIGSAFPCPVIFTGGINPLLWRPSHSFGAFDQPTYYIDASPHLGYLTDGKPHNFTLLVAGMGAGYSINDNWFLSANIQLKLANCQGRTTGKLIHYSVGPPFLSPKLLIESTSNISASLNVTTSRVIQIKSILQTCEGKLSVKFYQNLRYTNSMTLADNGNDQTVVQETNINADSVHNDVIVFEQTSTYGLGLNTTLVNQGQVQILGSHVNLWLTMVVVEPVTSDVTSIKVDQNSNGDFKMKNNIGFAGQGNQTMSFAYKDIRGFNYGRKVMIEKNYLISDEERGSLIGYPSGFSPELIDSPDSPPSDFIVRSPRLLKKTSNFTTN